MGAVESRITCSQAHVVLVARLRGTVFGLVDRVAEDAGVGVVVELLALDFVVEVCSDILARRLVLLAEVGGLVRSGGDAFIMYVGAVESFSSTSFVSVL